MAAFGYSPHPREQRQGGAGHSWAWLRVTPRGPEWRACARGDYSPSLQHDVSPHPTPCPPRRPVATPTCWRPHSHCAWVPNGPWVAALNVPPGYWETIMNHQKATIVLRRATAYRDLLSFIVPPLVATVASRRERRLYWCCWRDVRDGRKV